MEPEVPIPSFHDGNFVGMLLLAEKQCALFISDVVGAMHNLTLSGIEGFRADNFLEGNIVLDVTVRTEAEVSKEDVLFALSLDDDHVGHYRASADAMLERVRRGELHLVQVYASYGCTLTSLCASVSYNSVQRDDVIRAVGI
jgi:hypothetical protein